MAQCLVPPVRAHHERVTEGWLREPAMWTPAMRIAFGAQGVGGDALHGAHGQ